jgi:hypothetical protein
MAVLASATVYAQTAVLVRNNQPVGAFSGVNSLINAVNAAEASGDLIILGSGTFNVPGEINKAVSIYGQGFEDASTRTYLNNKLQYRSTGEGSLNNIHLEGLYISNHLNLLNDGNRSPMNNLTIEKCFITGMFLYMDNNGTTIRNCVMQGDLKSYPGDYKATNMLIENCWKDGGSFNHFIADSKITIKNSIFYCRSISGFDNSSAFINATYENSVIASCSLAANSTATKCVLIGVSSANATTTDCQTASSVTEAFENVTTLVYSAGTVPTLKSNYAGIGITEGDYVWNTTPSRPTVNFETTLEKDADGYYQIGTAEDWIELKRVVENIEPMANAKMTADIDLGDAQAMIGNGHWNNETYRKAFGGIFDGQGHTLTIRFVTADILQSLINSIDGYTEPSYLGCAPFGFVCGGTIRNLNTAGTITSTHEGVAGIVGWTDGSTLIENCHSSVNLEITNGYRGVAGIIYNTLGNGELTIRDCIYDGTLTAGSNKTGAAGFFVMRGGGKANVFNSLLLATYANGLGTGDCATFVRNGLGGGIITNSFYKTVLGEAQGVQATETELANGRTAFYLQAGREDLVWGQEIGVDPYPVLTSDASKRVYRSADGYTNDPSKAIADQALVPLTYTIDSNGELTITGFDQGFTPTADYDLVIPADIDEKTVVSIAASAFKDRTTIKTVDFPSTLKKIGQEAFRNCSGLTTVTIPANVTSMDANVFWNSGVTTATIACPTLGQGAFYQCSKLETVTIEEGVKVLGINDGGAFHGCSKLATVTIPSTVTTMARNVFRDCTSLTTVNFAEGIQLETIPEYAFYNTALTRVDIPASVKTIGTEAFRYCKMMEEVNIPSNTQLTTINTSAFADCVLLPTFAMPNTLTSLGNTVFYNCQKMENITFSTQLTTIPDGTFQKCSKLNNVTIPKTITQLGSSAFRECSSLSSIVIPNTITAMGTSVFQDCTGLTSATFEEGFTMNYIPNNTFYNTRFSSFTIPASVQTINSQAFMNNTALASIEFPATVTKLASEAFRNCSGLTEVTIPATITTMEANVFWNSGVKTATVACSTLGQGAFYQCAQLETVTIEEGVQVLGINDGGAFHGCSKLATVNIPSTVTTLARNVFRDCTSLTTVNFTEGNQLETIPDYAFSNTGITSINMPSTVTTIGNYAFGNCSKLESAPLPQGLKTIGSYAFQYCEKLNNVVLPGTLISVKDWAFRNCTSMENLTIEEGISCINRDVFQYSGMKNVVLPSTIEAIGVNLFYQCNQLEVLDLSKCVNVWELYSYTSLRGSNYNITYGVPSTTKIILPPYTTATLGTNDEIATITFDLQQDGEGYYLINNTSDWDKFVVYSRQNPEINGRLTADLDLTDHPGKLGVGNGESNYITYQGTFDGQGHMLTIEYKTGKDVSGGLFAYVENATIKNLKVEGNVTANNRLIGGFVGFVKPSTTLTMQDCESAVHFTVTPTTTNMHIAGFIGQGKTSTVTLTDCLFTGSITGNTSFRYAAAFLGWMESAGRITYNYCLNNGTFTNTDKTFTYALGATNSSGQSTSAVCYFKDGNIGNNETKAIAVIAEQLASGMVTYRLQGGRTEQHWGQLLGRDPYPLLTNEEGTLVYRGQTYTNEYVEYAGLQKDKDDYYLIGGSADWEEFCLVVEDFPKSNARMTADVEVADNSMVGTSSMPYSGIFDGQGHTLSVKYLATADYCAPFRYINGATICNLHTMGTINTAYRVAGGVAADLKGTNTIDQCWSSVSITSTYSGDVTNGGIVAYNESGTLDITNCLFDGSMTGSNAYSWGGLVGWRAGTVNMTNCLFIPTSVNVNEYSCATFVRNNATINNSYYSQTINNSIQGTQVTADQLTNGYATYKLQGKQDELVWAQTLGTDEQPMLAVFQTDAQRIYRTIEGYSNNPEEGVLTQDAEGYYLIGSADDWKMLAMLVDEGEYEAKARMTADIDLGDDQTMIGSGDNDDNHGVGNVIFQGTFDGQGHTLTIHYNVSQITVAPFRHIQNATIKNLHVAGTITTSNRHAGGIVGACYGEQIHSYITNCISSVNITSNYVNTGDFYGGAFTGGIAARLYYYGQLHITDCIFDGSISGETRGVVWGGFLGLPDGTVTIENSLQIGTFNCSNVISGSNGSGTFSSVFGNGYASRVNVSNNCYYLNQLGNAQGTLANATTLSDGTITTALQAGRTEEIWVQDASTGQPILALFKKNNGIATGLRVITDNDNDTWFTLEGMKLDTKPKQPGVYIKNGRRIIIK